MGGKRIGEILCSRWSLFIGTTGLCLVGGPIVLDLAKMPSLANVGVFISLSIPAIAGFLPSFVRSLREPHPTIGSCAIGPLSLAVAIIVLSFVVAPTEVLRMRIAGSCLVFTLSTPILLPAVIAGRLCAAPFRKRFLSQPHRDT